MRLIFIRHGDPDYAADSLTEKGWREARLLADRICRWPVDQFYCSPLGRARATAQPTLERLHRTAEILDWLQEFAVGAFEPGHTGTRVIPWDYLPSYWTAQPVLYQADHWTEAECFDSPHLRRCVRQVTEPFDALLARWGYRRQGGCYQVLRPDARETLVFFCHLGSQFLLLSHLLGISPVLLWQGAYIHPTGVTVVTSEEREAGTAVFRLQRLGDLSHLYAAGEAPSPAGFFQECQPHGSFPDGAL